MIEDKKHPINKIMEEALNKIKTIIDVDTVIGAPLKTMDGITIIPITKVSVGFIAGGGEYAQNVPPKKQKDDYAFAGGSSAGFNINPIGFLVGKENNLKFVGVDSKDSFEKIFKTCVELVNKLANK